MTINEAINYYANEVYTKIRRLRRAVLNGDSNEADSILDEVKEDAIHLIWLKDLE